MGDSVINVGWGGALFLLFLGLKLGNVIDWKWIWVFSPLWISLALGLIGVFIYFGFMLLKSYIEERRERTRRELREIQWKKKMMK